MNLRYADDVVLLASSRVKS